MIRFNHALTSLALATFFAAVAGVAEAQTKKFDYTNLLLTYWQLDAATDFEAVVDGYMETYRPAVWHKYRDDEFELDEKRQETIAIMKRDVAAVDIDVPLEIVTRTTFGEYDFDKGQFAFEPLANGVYFYETHCCNALPRQLKLTFSNADIVSGIPMTKDEAKKFLQQRKSYGSVDRNVYLSLEVTPSSSVHGGEVVGEITRFRVFADDRGREAILTYRKEN